MRHASIASLLLLILPVSAVQVRVASFNIGAHFGTTYFDYSLGNAGTPDHDSVRAILSRIDADVVAMQEIHTVDLQGNPNDLDDLANSLGYPYRHVTPLTGAFDTSLRVIIMSRFPFLLQGNIGSPAGAKELTRLHPVVKIDVPGTTRDLVMISAHLKAETALADRFRRAVEMKRLVGHLATAGLTAEDNYVILGDFNPSSVNTTFAALPSGLPGAYVLGSDLTFPISYSTDPLDYFTSPGAVRLDARQLDGSDSTFDTDTPGGPTLDLMLVSPAIAGRAVDCEVYNSALDVSNNVGLVKNGSPPPQSTSFTASDHYPVFADLELDPELIPLDLSLSAASVAEGSADGTVVLNVGLPAARPGAVTVTLASDNPGAALPADSTLVIPAGALGGSMPIRNPRNFIADPLRSVTFTATASGYDSASAGLQVSDADGSYAFTAPGQTLVENFNGFAGDHDPAPWTTGGGLAWLGIDDGSSATSGMRSYGSALDSSLGFLSQAAGTTATAAFINQSSLPLTSLHIALDFEQWRAAAEGTEDSISAELVISGQAIPLPGLSFTASKALPNGPVPGGAATTLTAMAGGLSIPPGAGFDLRVMFVPGSGGGVAPGDVFVNEFHYDNSGTDANEFVEIVIAPGYAGSLADIDVVLYNGENATAGVPYDTLNLASDFTLGATINGYRIFSAALPANGIQNGSCDGIAVIDKATSRVLHFISYEGPFSTADGMAATDVGFTQNGSDPAGYAAIGLTGTGGTRADFTWTKFTGITHSPGLVNQGQSLVPPTLPSQGLAIDNLRVTFLTDNDLDGVADSADPDDDNDGQSDAHESAFGSDSFNASSRFQPVLARAAAAPHGFELSFPGAPGIRYTVEVGTTLSNWQDLSTHLGTGQAIVVPLPVTGPRTFFRVRAGD